MTEANAAPWLENWAREHLTTPGHPHEKAAMQAAAKACAQEAEAVGFSIAQLKEAAGGDLEEYLLSKQNAKPG